MKKMTCESFISKMNSAAVMYVRFTKANGDEREMMCTRNPAAIPEDKTPRRLTATTPLTVVPVFDLDIQEWRSIRPDSILDMKVIYDKESLV